MQDNAGAPSPGTGPGPGSGHAMPQPAGNGAGLDFDEATYIRAFPDVAAALQRGDLASGWQHYELAGRAEDRLQSEAYRAARDAVRGRPVQAAPRVNIDLLVCSPCGATLVMGWVDDRQDPLREIQIRRPGSAPQVLRQVVRCRRPDVETIVAGGSRFQFGFWAISGAEPGGWPANALAQQPCSMTLVFGSGHRQEIDQAATTDTDAGLLARILKTLREADYPTNRRMAQLDILDAGVGDAVLGIQKSLSGVLASKAVAERFGPQAPRLRGSIIIPLGNRLQGFFTQSCAYASCRGIEDYEFVYVIDSPDLMEPLSREARIAQLTYGLCQTLVLCPGDVGTGGAFNIGASFARSDRLVCTGPTVFPGDETWAACHTQIIEAQPMAQTRLFGLPVCGSEGTLMQCGVYFEPENLIASTGQDILRRTVLRPAEQMPVQFIGARRCRGRHPVPAVGWAFMSVDRAWFEDLDCFSSDYIAGRYADLDFCLRSLQRGHPAWIQEGMMRQFGPAGAPGPGETSDFTLMNQWLLSTRWQSFMTPDLLGRHPSHPALAAPGHAIAAEPDTLPVARAPRRGRRSSPGPDAP